MDRATASAPAGPAAGLCISGAIDRDDPAGCGPICLLRLIRGKLFCDALLELAVRLPVGAPTLGVLAGDLALGSGMGGPEARF